MADNVPAGGGGTTSSGRGRVDGAGSGHRGATKSAWVPGTKPLSAYEETAPPAEEALEATWEETDEAEAARPVEEDMTMVDALEAPEAAEAEAPPLVTPAAPAAEVAEAFKQSVEEPAWMVTGEE